MVKATETRIETESSVIIDSPVETVIDVEVQHPVTAGQLSNSLGTFGAFVAIQPNGQPRVVVRIAHDDGTSLIAVMKSDEIIEAVEILVEAHNLANESQRDAKGATRQ